MQEEMRRHVENDRFAAFVGIKLTDIGPGYAAAELVLTADHLNGVGVVHGAAIFALADYVFAAASNAGGAVTLAVNAGITFFKAPRGSKLAAEAKEITASRRLGHYNVDIFDDNGELVAQFKGTGYIKR